MPLTTRLTERLHIRHPVVSAPMASVGGGRVAAAVCAGGGLGPIGGGCGDATWIERESGAGNADVACPGGADGQALTLRRLWQFRSRRRESDAILAPAT